MRQTVQVFKKVLKWVLYILLIPVTYIVGSLILSAITINRSSESQVFDKSIFLSSNGVHLDIVLPINDVDAPLLAGINHGSSDRYLSFGWGDENFYLNTRTWADLTFGNAFQAVFLKSTTLMHVTRHRSRRAHWVEIKVSESELKKLNAYISETFVTDENGRKQLLKNQGYSYIDDFYKAQGSYSCFKTCNTWVNAGFKESGLKSCLWTPFDFGLLHQYE